MSFIDKVKGFFTKEVADVAATVSDKFISKFKMDAGSKRELEAELQQALWAFIERNGEKFQEFILDYEGRAKEVPRWVVGLRAIVRPILTFLCFGCFVMLCIAWLYGDAISSSEGFEFIFNATYRLTLIVFVFWFGDRLLQNNLDALVNVFKRPKQPKE